MRQLTSRALILLREHGRSLLALHLTLTRLSIALLPSLVAGALAAMRPITGDAAITTGGLIRFLASPGGLLWVGFSMLVTITLLLIQQAGIVLITSQPAGHPVRTAARALLGVARRGLHLVGLAVMVTLSHLLLALPFLTAIVGASALLLHYYDPYLLNLHRPPVLWWYGGFCLTMVAGIIVANGTLLLRWALAVPVLILDRCPPRTALGASWRLTTGRARQTVSTLAAWALVAVATPPLVTLMFNLLATGVLRATPDSTRLLVPVMLALVSAYLLLGLVLTFLATSAFGTLVMAYYREVTGKAPHWQAEQMPQASRKLRRAWVLEAVVVALILVQSFQIVMSMNQTQEVTITAHRGSAFAAPENSLSAIHQAIDDGADYIEIDVQLTRDGVPVLWHDSDMQRIFGRPERINEVAYDDIKDLDAGSWFDARFADERVTTLAQAIDAVRGRAGLFVDLKPNRNTTRLVTTVVELLQQKNAVQGTVIAASDWPALEQAKQLEPELKTALLAQFVVGPLWQDHYDILGLRFNRASPGAVARTHNAGNELHVWTVNNAASMSRFIDMGVDNIITDRPDVLADLLEQRAALSDAELLAVRLRNWLR